MRLPLWAIGIGLAAAIVQSAWAASGSKTDSKPPATSSGSHIEVTADQSLEWYQDQRLYVARGNAKAVRGDMTVDADLLTAHEREAPAKPGSAKANIYGDHGVYDLVKHVTYLTGNNLKYETAEEVVTSRDSLEYWEDTKIA